MPNVTKTHPTSVVASFENQGANLQFFTVDYIVDVSAETANGQCLDKVYQLISNNATLVCAGPLFDTGSQQTFAVEALGGQFPTSNWDGTNQETWETWLQTEIVLLGTIHAINCANFTVTAKTLAIVT